jgi:hypothetical protein
MAEEPARHSSILDAPRIDSSPAARAADTMRFGTDKEVGRRTDMVGIFPDDRSLIRLAGMLCIEQNDEWLVGRGHLSAESISLCLADPEKSYMGEIKQEVPELQPT